MIHRSAASHQDEEEVANQIDAMTGHVSWPQALVDFATFGPVTGNLE